MIKSMTGYGIGTATDGRVNYTVELKSLNSKFLELSLRLPRTVADKELQLRNARAKLVERGKVNFTATAEYTDQTLRTGEINAAVFEKYYHELMALSEKLGVAADRSSIFREVLRLPEVVSQNDESSDPEEGAVLIQAFEQAFAAFDQFRKDEGNVLRKDLSSRALGILELLAKVEEDEQDRIPLIRSRIEQYLDQTVGREQVDMNRFEQELIYYIDKLDITEEKVRLRSHCEYFLKVLDSGEANGKKLSFISQEIGREVNTLGSKANDARIQQTVIRMKEELEKIKEQLLNVL